MDELPACRLDEVGEGVVLCATHRLARRLRADHDAAQRVAGRASWTPLAALGVDVWLDQVIDGALLDGSLPATDVPRLALSHSQEQVLWEQVIAADTAGDEADPLLDREGLAELAVEANALVETWALSPDEGGGVSAETEAFLRWRREVRARCRTGRWLEATRMRNWRIARIAAGAGRLPQRLAFAGFDRYTPQEAELARVLGHRGVVVLRLELTHGGNTRAVAAEFPDRAGECRAAAAWASRLLADAPQTRLAIVVPQLAGVRDTLVAALDDALHPEALWPANAEMPRRYNVSLGLPLMRWPPVAVALRLLRIAVQPRRILQTELAALLHSPYWSSTGPAAMAARARLDARMRELLPPIVTLTQLLRLARRLQRDGLPLKEVIEHCEALQAAGRGRADDRQSWPDVLAGLLAAAGWPGERAMSSHEWQVRRAFSGALQELGALVPLLNEVRLPDAVRHLARICRQRIFQPESEGNASVEVLGPLEAAGGLFDAVWVLGMNDDAWPPPPRPNPLLPAALQRRAGSPNAGAEVQLEFAAAVHRRLMASAPDVVFSWAAREGDRPLRRSPLLAGLTQASLPAGDVSKAESDGAALIERIDDRQAPPLAAGSKAGGGVGLLRAQAACPAWAFYRYRLGAAALDEPSEGLGAAERGTLLHRVLERFWRGRDSGELRAMSEAQRRSAAEQAVRSALQAFNEEREVPLSPRFGALEAQRLERLLLTWLPVELARAVPFVVEACESTSETDIAGLRIDVRVDRVDALADGRLVVLDYKTGRDLRVASWLGERIYEPQLPVYAAWTAQGPPAAVAFARVREDGCGFVGLAAEDGLLPGVRAATDWQEALKTWRAGIAALASEFLAGDAAVRIADEKLVRYCEVLPLLRLPERRAEMERE